MRSSTQDLFLDGCTPSSIIVEYAEKLSSYCDVIYEYNGIESLKEKDNDNVNSDASYPADPEKDESFIIFF